MTLPAPTYDLVLMLDLEAEAQSRAKILADASAAISSQGELLRHDEWGQRELTYPIDHKTAAEYHLLQFHAASPELLSGLDRSLRIADEVIRHRIVKLAPGTPEAPDMRSAGAPSRTVEAEVEPETAPATAPPAAPATAPAVAPETAPAAAPETAPEVVSADAAVGEPAQT